MPTDSASPSAAPLSRTSDESPRNLDEVSLTPHEMLHQMVKHLTFDERYRPKIEAMVAEVRDTATVAARNYRDPLIFFDECLVRSLDFTVRLGPEYDYDNSRLKPSLGYQVKIGFGLALPMRDALTAYEAGEGTFTEFVRPSERGVKRSSRRKPPVTAR